MKSKQDHCGNIFPVRRWAVLVCFLLVGIAILAQAFHLHPNELAKDARHCTICQVAHAPGQVASSGHIAFGVTAIARFTFSNDADPKPFLALFSLFSRPPPA